jgi:hypothetical protein
MGPWLHVYGFNLWSGWAQSYKYMGSALLVDGPKATDIWVPRSERVGPRLQIYGFSAITVWAHGYLYMGLTFPAGGPKATDILV